MIPFNDFTAEVDARRNEYAQAITNVLDSGWFILGKEVERFEKNVARYMGSVECIGVANGLEALQICLMALGIGVGDEVITTPVSAVATTLAVLAVGAKPVFVDVDENGLLDESLVEAAITKKTKVVLPVHLYGNAVNLQVLQKICRKYGLHLLEDAAQAHGSSFKNKKLGSIGVFGCLSFYPTKNMGAFGDGGAILTNNRKYAKICREIRDYGQTKKYYHTRYGLNSRLDELQAAILQVKLNYLEKDNKHRRVLAKKYEELLSDVNEVKIIHPQPLDVRNIHVFAIRVKNRDKLQKYLQKKNITTLVHYPLIIPDQPFLKGEYLTARLPKAKKFVKEVLSLPCHPMMSVGEVEEIAKEIIKFFQK